MSPEYSNRQFGQLFRSVAIATDKTVQFIESVAIES